MHEAVIAVEIITQLIRKIDMGDVVSSTCGDRKIRWTTS